MLSKPLAPLTDFPHHVRSIPAAGIFLLHYQPHHLVVARVFHTHPAWFERVRTVGTPISPYQVEECL
jgi:hypothetical protein